jgi:hypothetical protein
LAVATSVSFPRAAGQQRRALWAFDGAGGSVVKPPPSSEPKMSTIGRGGTYSRSFPAAADQRCAGVAVNAIVPPRRRK